MTYIFVTDRIYMREHLMFGFFVFRDFAVLFSFFGFGAGTAAAGATGAAAVGGAAAVAAGAADAAGAASAACVTGAAGAGAARVDYCTVDADIGAVAVVACRRNFAYINC